MHRQSELLYFGLVAAIPSAHRRQAYFACQIINKLPRTNKLPCTKGEPGLAVDTCCSRPGALRLVSE
eukprot:4123848-Pleurochrysis_carterae.AAC.2